MKADAPFAFEGSGANFYAMNALERLNEVHAPRRPSRYEEAVNEYIQFHEHALEIPQIVLLRTLSGRAIPTKVPRDKLSHNDAVGQQTNRTASGKFGLGGTAGANMKDCDEYQLWIDAFTPETIPMDRLAAYLSAFAKLLGNNSSVHFSRVDSGSTKPVALVEREACPKVWARIDRLSTQQAANDEQAAFRELNDLARADNATGQLIRVPQGGSASVVLSFPGRDSPPPSKFGPFTEPAEVDGELVRIGGRDSTAHVTVVDAQGKSWPGEISKEQAQRMAPFLYKEVRVRGDARWERSEDGVWKLLLFKVSDFDPLPEDGLAADIGKLRSLRDSDWAKSADIDAEIRAARGHEDGLH